MANPTRRDALRLLVGSIALGSGLTLHVEPVPAAEAAPSERAKPKGLRFRLTRGERVLQEGELPSEVVEALSKGAVEMRLVQGPWGQPERVVLRQTLPPELREAAKKEAAR